MRLAKEMEAAGLEKGEEARHSEVKEAMVKKGQEFLDEASEREAR